MESLRDRLLKKGWSEREVDKTLAVLNSAEEKKSSTMRFLDRILIWISLFIAVAGNFILSVMLVPFLILMSGASLYFAILCFGASFGMVFVLILRTIERSEIKSHIIAGVFIPVIGMSNMYIIVRLTNKLMFTLQLSANEHNPALVSMIYMFAFLIPYLVLHYFTEFHKKSSSTAQVS